MYKLNSNVTDKLNFFEGLDPFQIIKEFGTPLYIYNEKILRRQCKILKNFVAYPKFAVHYSAKANSNIALLQIIQSEGLKVDAMSPGELLAELAAGFKPEDIFYVTNNISSDEMEFVASKSILMSVDSVSQLEQFARLEKGKDVAVRFNPGVGTGHHEKVVTGGKNTKFGINAEDMNKVIELSKKYNLNIVGINQHIGSLFMDGSKFFESIDNIVKIAENFKNLEFIDFGGGFGIPYQKQQNEAPLDLDSIGEKLTEKMYTISKKMGRDISFRVEPGRYTVAECGAILGTVNATKCNGETKYLGTDIGFNVLARPMIYGSHHDIEIYNAKENTKFEVATVVGNICESGDILAKNYNLPKANVGDIVAILDAGAYGFTMSSNYNSRLRPAEILIRDGKAILIRERDTYEDLLKPYKLL